MIKNIILVLLVGTVAFLLISNRNTERNTETITQEATEENEQTDSEQTPETPTTTGKTIDLSNQGLERLPSYVFEDSSIEALDISGNNLSGALPGEIRQLKNLIRLDASDNDMTGVPAEMGQLENLEILDLSNNKLTGLPYELGNLKNLKELNLSGNNYSEQDLQTIKENLPADTEIIL